MSERLRGAIRRKLVSHCPPAFSGHEGRKKWRRSCGVFDRSSTCPYFALVAEVGKRHLVPHALCGCGYRMCLGLAQRGRSRGERSGDVARSRSACPTGFGAGQETAPYRWKVFRIVDPVVLHGTAAEAISIGVAHRDSRSGGSMGGAHDGASDVPRSTWKAAENAAFRGEVSGRKRALRVVKHGVHWSAGRRKPKASVGLHASRCARVRVLVFDMWIAQRPCDASRPRPAPKGARVMS